jgi:hypothetical protein
MQPYVKPRAFDDLEECDVVGADLLDGEVRRAILWLNREQDREAIGSTFGVRSRRSFQLSTYERYFLRAVPFTSVAGLPSLQIVLTKSWLDPDRKHPRTVPNDDQDAFKRLVEDYAKVYTDWDDVSGVGSFYAVAIKVPVTKSLVMATTRNATALACTRERRRDEELLCPSIRCDCPFRIERMRRFTPPEGWR